MGRWRQEQRRLWEAKASETEVNTRTIRRIYEEVLNSGAFDLAAELFDPQVVDHRRLPGEPSGLANILKGAQLNRAAFPDLKFALDAVVADEDLVFVRWTMRGTHQGEFMGRPPTGHPVEWHGITQFRLARGLVMERWLYADDLALLEQVEGPEA